LILRRCTGVLKLASVRVEQNCKVMTENLELMQVFTVKLTQYCAGGKIERNEMGRACGAYGGV
jgi:hypothetical protein